MDSALYYTRYGNIPHVLKIYQDDNITLIKGKVSNPNPVYLALTETQVKELRNLCKLSKEDHASLSASLKLIGSD